MKHSIESLRIEFERWFASLNLDSRKCDSSDLGDMEACLALIEELMPNVDLELENRITDDGTLMKGGLDVATRDVIATIREELRAFLDKNAHVGCLESLFDYDASRSTSSVIAALLEAARQSGRAGAVARHLVGANLEMRFPELIISNHARTAAGASEAIVGEFRIGDTTIYIMVNLMWSVRDKIQSSLDAGSRVFLLVVESKLAGAQLIAEPFVRSSVAIESIESFVANNIEEVGEFTRVGVKDGLRRLIETYNRRVNDAESDKSLLIELPANLA